MFVFVCAWLLAQLCPYYTLMSGVSSVRRSLTERGQINDSLNYISQKENSIGTSMMPWSKAPSCHILQPWLVGAWGGADTGSIFAKCTILLSWVPCLLSTHPSINVIKYILSMILCKCWSRFYQYKVHGSKLTFSLGSTGAPNFKKLGAPVKLSKHPPQCKEHQQYM